MNKVTACISTALRLFISCFAHFVKLFLDRNIFNLSSLIFLAGLFCFDVPFCEVKTSTQILQFQNNLQVIAIKLVKKYIYSQLKGVNQNNICVDHPDQTLINTSL
uniref:Uncharacterized protein n=1 Tax=Cynoglossus semilaevis TaxID=244447 RepID=A0A3P8VVJ4_CYNSE